MVDLAQAILAINPSAQFNINADDVAQIEWTKGTTPIANVDILAKQAELQTAYDNDYARKRKEIYPTIEECVHAMLDDGLVELQEKRAVVKARFPK